jgi:imidazolonepropionase-like amidohydrolase
MIMKFIHIHKANTMKKKLLICILLGCGWINFSQAQVYTPAPEQKKSILLRNAVIHDGKGLVIENGAIGFANGIINFVGKVSALPSNLTYDSIADISGKHIYPGLIACNTIIGLSEIEAIRAANDFNEVGNINAGVRSLIAYNTDSKVTPTLTVNGVLTAQVVPQGGLISGTSSVVSLDAWNWEDAALSADNALHVNWPSSRIVFGESSGTADAQKERYQKNINMLDAFFQDAKAYASKKPAEINLQLEAASDLFKGKKKLFVHARYVKDMLAAISYFDGLDLPFVFVGADDSWMIADLLGLKKIPVILMRTHDLPEREDEDIDQPFKTPFILKKAGVEVAIAVDGFWQVRTLSYNAGTAATYGLSKEEALSTITYNAARILGIDQQTGSLEIGKQATLLICNGDIMEMKESALTAAFLNGRRLPATNYQDLLYLKYLKKYEGTKP